MIEFIKFSEKKSSLILSIRYMILIAVLGSQLAHPSSLYDAYYEGESKSSSAATARISKRSPLNLPETPLGFYGKNDSAEEPDCVLRKEFCLPNAPYVPSKNQGPLGTCVSFAAIACYELSHPGVRCSEAEFTVLAETTLPKSASADCRSGLHLGAALRLARKMGFVEEERLTYRDYLKYVARKNGINPKSSGWEDKLSYKDDRDEAEICVAGDYNATMDAMGVDVELSRPLKAIENITSYRFKGITPIHHVSLTALSKTLAERRTLARQHRAAPRSLTKQKELPENGSIGEPGNAGIELVKKYLCAGQPIAAALRVFDDCWNPAQKNAFTIKMPGIDEESDGSHAVVLTGFNETHFIVRNSWGKKWGNKGYALIPYEYIKLYATELVAVNC